MFVGLRYFLDELLFIQTPKIPTSENLEFSVLEGEQEIVVRFYEAKSSTLCAIFFPGRSGGAKRYEEEIFSYLKNSGISVYAISLPGYDGAAGRSTIANVLSLGNKVLQVINNTTPCKMEESVYIGRSLGAAIAAELAVKIPPAGILADSVAPSLADALRAKLKEKWFTLPAAYLPLESLMAVNPSLNNALSKLTVNVVIMQGSNDSISSYEEVNAALARSSNVKVVEIEGGTHSNTHIIGRNRYLQELISLYDLR